MDSSSGLIPLSDSIKSTDNAPSPTGKSLTMSHTQKRVCNSFNGQVCVIGQPNGCGCACNNTLRSRAGSSSGGGGHCSAAYTEATVNIQSVCAFHNGGNSYSGPSSSGGGWRSRVASAKKGAYGATRS